MAHGYFSGAVSIRALTTFGTVQPTLLIPPSSLIYSPLVFQADLNAVSESLSSAVDERDHLAAQQKQSSEEIESLQKQVSTVLADSAAKMSSLSSLLETTEAAAAAGRSESQEHSEAKTHELRDSR